MKTTQQILGLSILSLALAAGSAYAQSATGSGASAAATAAASPSSPKTRAQVKQELLAAERNGETKVGFVAMSRGELDPDRYPLAEQARYARAHTIDQNRSTQ
jgi:hypothetical protein